MPDLTVIIQGNEKIHLGSAVFLNNLSISTFAHGGCCSFGYGQKWKELEYMKYGKDPSLENLISIPPPPRDDMRRQTDLTCYERTKERFNCPEHLKTFYVPSFWKA